MRGWRFSSEDQLKQSGIESTLSIMESAAYAAQTTCNLDVYFWNLLPGLDDPDQACGELYITGSIRNYEGYSTPRFDELYEKQARSLDFGEHWELALHKGRGVFYE